MTFTALARQRPLVSLFALAYGISWGAILIVLAASRFDLGELRPLDTGLIFMSMLLGPSVSGLVLTAFLEGRPGLHRLGASLGNWHAGIRWYALALLTMPLLLFATLWLLGVFVNAAFLPRFQWQLFAVGLVAGTFEEVGWTGFATPRLLVRHRPFIAGLLLGLLWALWHALVDFRQNFHAMGVAWLLEFAVFYVASLTAYRLLMMRLYVSNQSLLRAVLMHASYTGWLFALYPSTSFEQGLLWQAVLAMGLWLAVGVGFRKPMQPDASATGGSTMNRLHRATGPSGDELC